MLALPAAPSTAGGPSCNQFIKHLFFARQFQWTHFPFGRPFFLSSYLFLLRIKPNFPTELTRNRFFFIFLLLNNVMHSSLPPVMPLLPLLLLLLPVEVLMLRLSLQFQGETAAEKKPAAPTTSDTAG